jgi:tRNA(Ile)-lysidine synthase
MNESLQREFPSPARVVLAVSGGADSVAMLRSWHAIRQGGEDRVVVASFDHGLRPESVADVEFAGQLAGRLGFGFVTGSPERAIEKGKGYSIESAARRERYAFLNKVAVDHGASAVLTAHTADDQIETVLFRIVRGTGLAGLAGIPTRRRLAEGIDVVRPMLGIRRGEIEAYLGSIDQPFVDDSSNRSLSFARNRIRHVVLPLLRSEIHAGVDEALQRLALIAREEWESQYRDVRDLFDQATLERGEAEIVLSIDQLQGLSSRQLGRVLREGVHQLGGSLREISWKSVRRGLGLIDSSGPRRVEWPGGVVLERAPGRGLRIVNMRSAVPVDGSRPKDDDAEGGSAS